MSDMLFIYRWGVEDVSNEGQVTGLKGSRGEKRLIPADWPLEPLCCRERRKGQEEWRETRYSEKKTQMEGGGTSSRVNQNQNREQTYGLSRMTRQRRMDSKVKREGRDVNAASAMVDGVWAQRRLETAAAFFSWCSCFSAPFTRRAAGSLPCVAAVQLPDNCFKKGPAIMLCLQCR